MASTLVAHVDAHLVSLDALTAMAQPEPMGPRHRPLRHIDLVGAVREEVARRGLAILKERFAVGHHGATLFATFDLGVRLDDGEACWALGLRSPQDQSLALRGVAGIRVFVCDNLALRGDVFAFARRHTTALDLEATIRGGLARYQQQAELFVREIAGLKQAERSDDRAKRVI